MQHKWEIKNQTNTVYFKKRTGFKNGILSKFIKEGSNEN